MTTETSIEISEDQRCAYEAVAQISGTGSESDQLKNAYALDTILSLLEKDPTLMQYLRVRIKTTVIDIHQDRMMIDKDAVKVLIDLAKSVKEWEQENYNKIAAECRESTDNIMRNASYRTVANSNMNSLAQKLAKFWRDIGPDALSDFLDTFETYRNCFDSLLKAEDFILSTHSEDVLDERYRKLHHDYQVALGTLICFNNLKFVG